MTRPDSPCPTPLRCACGVCDCNRPKHCSAHNKRSIYYQHEFTESLRSAAERMKVEMREGRADGR